MFSKVFGIFHVSNFCTTKFESCCLIHDPTNEIPKNPFTVASFDKSYITATTVVELT